MTLTDVVWFVITETGWRYDWVLEDMDLVRLRQMTDYRRGIPPLHVMVGAYLRIGTKPKKKEADSGLLAELAKHAPMTPMPHLAAYRGGRIPKIGESLWQKTPST